MRFDSLDQGFRVGSTHALVDVQAIGRTTDGNDIGTQLMKNLGRNLIGRAMGAIHHDLHALQGEVVAESAFAKFNVTARRIV